MGRYTLPIGVTVLSDLYPFSYPLLHEARVVGFNQFLKADYMRALP